jgi:hypothetical protein
MITKTHDGRTVYPAGTPLPDWASGWVQCNNQGGAYSTWLDEADRERSKADRERIEREANALRTRAQCEAAMKWLGLVPGGTCREMRLRYQITLYADLWPLRQVG